MPLYFENVYEDGACEHPSFPNGRRWPRGSVWQCKKCKELFIIAYKKRNNVAGWYRVPQGIRDSVPKPKDTRNVWDEWIDRALTAWEEWGCPEFDKTTGENVPNPDYVKECDHETKT